MSEVSQTQLMYSLPNSNLHSAIHSTIKYETGSFFYSVELVRHKYSSHPGSPFLAAILKYHQQFQENLKKLEEEEKTIPCIFSREINAPLRESINLISRSTITKVYEKWQESTLNGTQFDPNLDNINQFCYSEHTVIEHVPPFDWLQKFYVNQDNAANFYDYGKNLALIKRIKAYTNLLQSLGASDVDSLLKSNNDTQKLSILKKSVNRWVSKRFSLNQSNWNPTQTFEMFIIELEDSPLIIMGDFLPQNFIQTAKKIGSYKEKSLYGWTQEDLKKTMNLSNSIVIVGYQKLSNENRVFFITPINYHESQVVYISSYERIKEKAEYLFQNVYALYGISDYGKYRI